MWIKISHDINEAIDANMRTVEAVKEAQASLDEDMPGAGLVKAELRYLAISANDYDTKLRRFLVAIEPDVKRQREGDKL